jgi:putrescine transport system ATP-binding protein
LEIYEYPRGKFVADFIGTINTFDGRVRSVSDDLITIESREAGTLITALGQHDVEVGQAVCVAIRPEKIFVGKNEPENDDDCRIQGVVHDLGYLGNLSLYRIQLANGKIVMVSSQNRRRSAQRFLEWEDDVWISWRPRSVVLLLD